MKTKLKLAIASIVLQFILSMMIHQFPYLILAGDGSFSNVRTLLFVLEPLSILGLLPFFVSLYKSKSFASVLNEKNSFVVNKKDHDWLKHVLIRVALIIGICLVFFLFSLLKKGTEGAYLVAYGIAYTLGIGSLLLIAEAVMLFVKKCPYKAAGNLILIFVTLYVLYGMM